MIKKIMAVLMTFVLSMSLVGCSNDSSDKKTTPKKSKNGKKYWNSWPMGKLMPIRRWHG